LNGLISYPRYLGYIKPHLLNLSEEEFVVRRKLVAKAWECRHLEFPVGKRILAISPHSDDESIGAGGLLWAHREVAHIHLVTLYDGAAGGSLPDAEPDLSRTNARMVQTRKEELSKTAAMLGARTCCHFDLPDGGTPHDQDALDRLAELVRELRPDVVLLPWFLDNHAHHRRANLLYAWSCHNVETTVLAYEVWSLLEPNALFDITDHLEAKLNLIRNYQSQLRTVDFLNYALGLAKLRAFHGSIRLRREGAAEAYIALPGPEYCELVCSMYGSRNQLKNYFQKGTGPLNAKVLSPFGNSSEQTVPSPSDCTV
jgi:LmbE family N-acetylglucosaminyl deacetylase